MAVAASVIGSIVLKILSSQLEKFISKEYDKFMNADRTFSNLCKSYYEANDLLQSMDYTPDNKFMQRQMDTMYRMCYDVEDLINDIDGQIQKKQNSASLHRKPVNDLAKSCKNIKVPRNIHELLEDVDAVKENLKTLDSNGNANVASTEEIYEFSELESMGREETAKAISTELTSQQDSHGASLIGIRGIGKRALAKHVLDSEEVRAKFPLILKASMSGKSFDMKNLELDVLFDNDGKISGLQSRQDSVLLLQRQQWLLWLDDLSHMPLTNGNAFRNKYPADENRKFLITTLNPDVANTFHTSRYYLKAISEKCCQELISKALENCRPPCSVSRNTIEDMAKQCYGLPLVAYFVALLLDTNGEGNLQHKLWHLPEFQDELFPHLTSSYKSLDSHIVKCFTYFSLFPLDYKFDSEDLSLLWISEGLAEACSSNPDNYWRNCFKGLLNNSILQPVSASDSETFRYEIHKPVSASNSEAFRYEVHKPVSASDSETLWYEIHKFTHSFIQLTAPKTYLQLTDQSSNVFNNVNTCHLSLSHDIQKQSWDGIKKLKCLRTFLSLYDGKTGQLSEMPRDLFTRLPRLRVLVLKNTNIDKLPNFVKNLRFLRHLDISKTLVKKVDDDFCTLDNLKVFKFKKVKTHPGNVPLQLPDKFSNLTNLVFLDWGVNDIKSLISMPRYIGKLVNLQTLPLFVVGKKKGYRIEELEKMKHLQGSLRITNLENVQGEEAKSAKISEKSFLLRLELEWTKSKDDSDVYKVLSGLEPHGKLQGLHIINYGNSAFPEWFSQPSLTRLEEVHLTRCNTLPTLEQFPELKAIHLEEMNTVTSIENLFCKNCSGVSHVCFGNLKSLVLSDLKVLRDLTGTNNMPNLSKLEIEKCPELKTLPSLTHLSLLADVKIQDCKALSSLLELPQSLQKLIINGSVLLARICQGHDWLSKISNELKVYIDGILLVKPTLASATALSNSPQQVSLWLSEYLNSLPDEYKF